MLSAERQEVGQTRPIQLARLCCLKPSVFLSASSHSGLKLTAPTSSAPLEDKLTPSPMLG